MKKIYMSLVIICLVIFAACDAEKEIPLFLVTNVTGSVSLGCDSNDKVIVCLEPSNCQPVVDCASLGKTCMTGPSNCDGSNACCK